MHGHAFELATQVPQGDIEPADGMNHGPGAPEIVQRALKPRRQTSIGRVLAERERRDPMVERRDGCLPTAAESFAPADDAAVGRDAHHERIDRGARRPANSGGGAQWSMGMRSAIASIRSMVTADMLRLLALH